ADIEQALHYLRQAIDVAPRFEIALFRNAYYFEMRLRMQDDLSLARVREVIEEYDQVLKVNAGNIAALASQGYLWWLCDGSSENTVFNLKKAERRFEAGRQVKAISGQTYIGDLNYGLARVVAELALLERKEAAEPSSMSEMLNRSSILFSNAIAAD